MTTEQRSRRTGWRLAAALVAATALAGAVARGTTRHATPGADGGTTVRSGPVTFGAHLDRSAVLRGGDGQARLEVVLGADGAPVTRGRRLPTDLIVVLDRSGSMAGEKIEHARAAVRELVAQLGADDRFALVAYANDAALAIPLAPVSDAARAGWLATIRDLPADGGTNMASGLDLALDTLERARLPGRAPRAILISDGLANQGDATPEGLVRRAGRAARGEYVLSAVGVGADFNEYVMRALADAGTGNYYYLEGSRELASVFARELDAARTTVASAVAVRIAPAPGVRVLDAAGYPLEHDGAAVVFRPGDLFAGQERRIWVTLAVPTAELGTRDVGTLSLAYRLDGTPRTLALAEMPVIACVAGENEFYAGVDLPSWTRGVVVDGYNAMQEQVAREVKAGRRDEALEAVRAFRDRTAAANARLQSPPVAAQLSTLDKLEADVTMAFEGAEQAERQNALSKSRSADALDARRAGSKR
ncbi:MAG TPA: VWA domain-containing protein [Candidatus Binatia bacterium]|nr:VWA domain-containing protein [Candidatus Binatia bacterium]